MEPIDVRSFVSLIVEHGLDLWAGVPDSLLKDLCASASEQLGEHFMITANEGNAVGVACGWHVGTGRSAVVYMQNSGEGNAINPLLSLADTDVYSVPMLLIIGWRGEPGVVDEPQHKKQGRVTCTLLDAMGIPYQVIDSEHWEAQLVGMIETMRQMSCPVALVIRKGMFTSYSYEPRVSSDPLTREEALNIVLDASGTTDLIVSTTGKESREVFELRDARGEGHDRDFLTVGGMGHTLSIAYGLALGQPTRMVWCLDGDGSMLMHLGSLPVFAQTWPENLRYVINVNGAHESVGGQPNVATDIDILSFLRACGLGDAYVAHTDNEVRSGMTVLAEDGAKALIIHTRQGSRSDLGRPTISPAENKASMMVSLGVIGDAS